MNEEDKNNKGRWYIIKIAAEQLKVPPDTPCLLLILDGVLNLFTY